VKSSYHFLYLLLFVAQVLSHLDTGTDVVRANIRCGNNAGIFLAMKGWNGSFFGKKGGGKKPKLRGKNMTSLAPKDRRIPFFSRSPYGSVIET